MSEAQLPKQSFETLRDLQQGDLVRIPFGSRGSSKARFVRWGSDREGNPFLLVERYLAKTDKWTQPVTIYPTWVLGRIAMVREAA